MPLEPGARRLGGRAAPGDPGEAAQDWLARLVRVLVLFRALVLLATVLVLSARQESGVFWLAAVCAALSGYLPLRRWRRIGPTVSRHPLYGAAEVLLATLLLALAGPRSAFLYFTFGTAALAGVVYGRRGAVPFSALLVVAYEAVARAGVPDNHPLHGVQLLVLVPLVYPAAVAAGVFAREGVDRGVEAERRLTARSAEISAERERLRMAREMHDSLAKTVEGLSLAAAALPGRCERDPAAAAAAARDLAADARQAAVEARTLMGRFRAEPVGVGTDAAGLLVGDAVRAHVEELAPEAPWRISVACSGAGAAPEPSPAVRHELLRILGEALRNVERHAQATTVAVELRAERGGWVLSVSDDGSGVPPDLDLDRLRAGGHYGLAGMDERARAVGGFLALAPRPGGGTVLTLTMVPETPPIELRRGRGRLRAAAAGLRTHPRA